MTARELLELAAKAADVSLYAVWSDFGNFEGYRAGSLNGDAWNPLTDDGDALRLAVKLRIDFCIDPDETRACAWSVPASDFMEEPLTPDPYAAARRAIVRAAAELGKAMP